MQQTKKKHFEIFKMLSLKQSNRNVDLKTFLDEKFGVYQKLCENSNVLEKKILDKLCPVPVLNDNIKAFRSQSTLTTEESSSVSSNEVIV